MNTRNLSITTAALGSTVLTLCPVPAHAQEKSRYMGGNGVENYDHLTA
jgi:hypothetical protein